MGTRYFLSGNCPKCKRHYDDVYYAPTCGIVEWQCQCGHVIDYTVTRFFLEKLTGITREEASNRVEIKGVIEEVCQRFKQKGARQ